VSILFSVTLVSIVVERSTRKAVSFEVKSDGSASIEVFKSSIADTVFEFIVMLVELSVVIDEFTFNIVEFNVLTLESAN